ncbi:outer membrane beta-barrel family protein [Rhizosphaericola mali]|uniref:Outer membrane beta-barrel protein n=1 Tax=Rhizosphaericola mali TaxID=2545455 RepID=A0A5P2G3Q5_9BACT|nr:outer membrane beta-barrel family protein [Rhizosphaericola mali]QES90446.1 outer membrane beta-barrel protein [Rhizosphaericola mali]
MPYRHPGTNIKKKLSITFTFICIVNFLYSQKTITGQINDSIVIGNMQNASIVLLSSKDSIILASTRSDENGIFHLPLNDTLSQFILVSYPNYVDFYQSIHPEGKNIELGSIDLFPKSRLLDDVTVRQKVSGMKLKGDTTEFIADSFRVQANASVEDLLKKMPGFQIDKNGKITANGQAVKKVLVDGEEFFGDDPTLVTQNLRADMVDKVQLYDKSSDQAAFTGIDDGVKDKTVNIKLKEDKKNGYFGKLSLGGGTRGSHENQGMFNKFKGKEKIAVYGTASNTGRVGLSWDDADQYGGGNGNSVISEDGNVITYFGMDDDSWNGQYEGNGIPLAQTAGAHYSNKWNDNKVGLNSNYKMSKLSVAGLSTSKVQNNLPTTINYSTTQVNTENKSLRNKVDAKLNWDIDTSNSFNIISSGTFKHINTFSSTNTLTQREDLTKLNMGQNINTLIGDNNKFDVGGLFKHKFSKVGRTLSIALDYAYNKNLSTGYVKSHNEFYNNLDELDSTIDVNQYKTVNTNAYALNAKAIYSEPLSKFSSLVFNYGITINNSHSDKLSYNQGNDALVYDVLDSTYSNRYSYDQFVNKGGIFFNYKKKKVQFNLGTNVLGISMDQKNLFNNIDRKRNFINWNPSANLNYSFTTQKRLSIRYNGTTNQPTLDQIQPITTNNDPLNLFVGNANLKPSFRNNYTVNYSDYKMLTDRDFYFYMNYGNTKNQITTNTYTDTSGKNTYQYINVNGNYNLNFYTGVYLKSKKFKNLRYGFSPSTYFTRSINFTNNVQNVSKSANYTLYMNVSKSVDSLFDASLRVGPNYTTNSFSIQSSSNSKYWGLSLNPELDVYLPLNFQIHSDLEYQWKEKTATLPQTSLALLNGWIGKKFFKKQNLLLKLYGFDILNQNKGIQRSQNNNTISQSINATIRRYFLLSLTWNFTGSITNSK